MEVNKNLIAPCGLYCGWCPFYVFKPKEYSCGGCWSRDKCRIRDCAVSRGLKLCTYCKDFPCDKLYKMYKNMDKFFDNVRKILGKTK